MSHGVVHFVIIFFSVQFQNEEVTEFDDTHGNKFYVIEHEGYYLAKKPIALGKIPDPRKNIPDVIRMEVRSDDVFLVAYPKAGNCFVTVKNKVILLFLKYQECLNWEFVKETTTLTIKLKQLRKPMVRR